MTEIKTYCDKCGAELKTLNDYISTTIDAASYYGIVDLCSCCYDKLTDLIKEFFEKKRGTGNE